MGGPHYRDCAAASTLPLSAPSLPRLGPAAAPTFYAVNNVPEGVVPKKLSVPVSK